jgi:hypothetical protein
MEGKLKNLENETQTLFDLEYGEKQYKCGKLEMHTVGTGVWQENWKSWKMRNTHCRTWNMVRNTEKREKWEMHTVGPGVW